MPAGASKKREKEYRKLKKKFEKSGRYEGREEAVASRIVNKQRAKFGETKRAKREERKGKSPDKGLPIENYRHLTVPQVLSKMRGKSDKEKREILRYEKSHKNRKTLLDALKG